MAEYRAELRAALEHEFEQAWLPMPPILYRYVKSRHADEIRTQHKLHASALDVHAAGDIHEFNLGWNLIRSTAQALGKRESSEVLSELCKRIADDRHPFEGPFKAYFACFTTQSDSDHMWKTFTNNDGVRFGFRTNELIQGLRGYRDVPVPMLLAVKYDPDDLIDAVENMILKIAEPKATSRMAAKPKLTPGTAANMPFHELRNVFVPMALSFKRERYKLEREWRIIQAGLALGEDTDAVKLACEKDAVPLPLPITGELKDPAHRMA